MEKITNKKKNEFFSKHIKVNLCLIKAYILR